MTLSLYNSLTLIGFSLLVFALFRLRWVTQIRGQEAELLRSARADHEKSLRKLKRKHRRSMSQIKRKAAARQARERITPEELDELAAHCMLMSERLAKRGEVQLERERELEERQREQRSLKGQVSTCKRDLKRLTREARARLEERANLTSDQGVAQLVDSICTQTELEVLRRSQRQLVEAEAYRDSRAAELMSLGRQRYYDPQPAERLHAYVDLPQSSKLREALLHPSGELLTLLNEVTRVEFVSDDKGEKLLLKSSPETYSREVARLTFVRWLSTNKLDEKSLRRQHERALSALEREAREAGQTAARHLGLKGIHPEILHLVGKLLFRTSYTQNQWQHAIEASELCGMMAAELNMDVQLARRATLLHDIGKVLWEETEAAGSHAVSGAVFAREHGELPEVVHPIGAHHHDEPPSTPLAYLVIAADTLSGARPGARRETSEAFSNHIEQLNELCDHLPGVRQHMVIQGGREVRLHVSPKHYHDLALTELTEEVAAEIEERCTFPGQIKVAALREVVTHAVARARYQDQRDSRQRARILAPLSPIEGRLSWGGERGVDRGGHQGDHREAELPLILSELS